MDAEAIARYLAYRLPEATNLRVANLTRVYPGMSRETWLTDVQWEEAGRPVQQGFVFRMNGPGGSVVPLPLSYEFEIYERLKGSGLPVAKSLWYERGQRWLMDGREFFVREKVEGTVSIPHVGDPDYRDLHIAMAKEHAEKLALIHSLDWRQHRFAELADLYPQWVVPRDETECVRRDVEVWETLYYETQAEPSPAMVYTVDWLKKHAPDRSPRIALVKGNNGMDEEIWVGTKIVGLSDWELAHLGDPREDWAWAAAQGIGQLWGLEESLAHYRKVSGIAVDTESLEYFRVLTSFKAIVCMGSGLRMFVGEKDLRPQVATMGLVSHLQRDQTSRMSITNQAQSWFSNPAAQ